MFAGPNGSGKTTIIKNFPKKIPLGIYVNADDIEKELRETGYIALKKYELKSTTYEIQQFIKTRGISGYKLRRPQVFAKFSVRNNKLKINTKTINSYYSADIAEFIRQKLLVKGISFSFETVLSHASKLEFLKEARKAGYKVYLYYVATDSPEININRVGIRVAKNGHPVKSDIIRKRYYRSLELLLDTIKLSNRAYLFDNSGRYYELVAEVTEGKRVQVLDIDKMIPSWFFQYVYEKL